MKSMLRTALNWHILEVQMAQDLTTLLAILGGELTLGTRVIRNERDLDTLIHEGLPVAALDHAIRALGATRRAILDGVGIARSTVRRRKGVEGKRLDLVESERTVRLGRIAALGNEALGSTEAAGRWLQQPNRALGGVEPISLLQTDVGAREVEAVLTRALLGGYS
jgi:putative toxin-antitoxin system antitoxin component (TIGR02293 family)